MGSRDETRKWYCLKCKRVWETLKKDGTAHRCPYCGAIGPREK